MAQVGAIKESIAELSEVFHSRLAELQQDLDKAGSSNPSVSSVASDFSVFKSFILKALDALQKQVELVAKQVEYIEERSRRKMLVIHGVKNCIPSSGLEDTTVLVIDKLKAIKGDVSTADVRRCHRLGKPRANKPQPILIKFQDISIRDKLWFGKVALKGTGITMGEFLTKSRHELFVAARDRFGVRRCWSWNGDVFVLDAGDMRHQVTSLAQLKSISVASDEPVAAPSTAEQVPSSVKEHGPAKRPKRVPKLQT